jgi:hypothetical protein
MRSVLLSVGAGLVLPRHLLATVLARCAVAGLCHVAGQYLPEPLASVSAFVAHVALLMAVFGLLAHIEAVMISHALRAADTAQPRFKAIAALARMRVMGRGAKLSVARMRGVGEASTLTSVQS